MRWASSTSTNNQFDAAPVNTAELSRAAGIKGHLSYRKRRQLIDKRFPDASRRRRPGFARRLKLEEARRLETVEGLSAAVIESHRHASDRDVRLAELTDAIFASGVTHVGVGASVQWIPLGNPAMPEVAFAGRSRVGSSSLLRALFKSNTAVNKASSQRSRDGINYFDVGAKFRVAETPGMGSSVTPFSEVLRHCVLIRNFVQSRPNLKMLYYLMDFSIEKGAQFRDIDVIKFLTQEIKNFTIVVTKAEEGDVSRLARELLEHGIEHPVLATSAQTMGGVDALRFDIVSNVLHSLPTLKLTPTHADALSNRLLTPSEMSNLKYLPDSHPKNFARRQLTAPHELRSEDELEWERLALEENGLLRDDYDDNMVASRGVVAEEEQQRVHDDTPELLLPEAQVEAEQQKHDVELAASPRPTLPVVALDGGELPKALTDPAKLDFVARTSPWRNPISWPAHVLPTRHPKINVIVSPEDPDNPYIVQARFAAPRGDFIFRRAPFFNLHYRTRPTQKGKYLPEPAPGSRRNLIDRKYSNPHYFPDIMDANATALPYAFSGTGYDGFWRSPERRRMTVLLHQQSTAAVVDPLVAAPGRLKYPLLGAELAKQEAQQPQLSPLAQALNGLPPPLAPSSTIATVTALASTTTEVSPSPFALSQFFKDPILSTHVGDTPPPRPHRSIAERFGAPPPSQAKS